MRAAAAALALVAVAGCGGRDEPPVPPAADTITLTSPAFKAGGELPTRFSCDGEAVSPPLRWSGVPKRAKDLALLVEDPDAPGGAFTHWTFWKLPVEPPNGSGRLLEGNPAPEGDQGKNDFDEQGWGSPCPPKGDKPHRYVFTVYAFDHVLDLQDGASVSDVRNALAQHPLAQGRLDATYGR